MTRAGSLLGLAMLGSALAGIAPVSLPAQPSTDKLVRPAPSRRIEVSVGTGRPMRISWPDVAGPGRAVAGQVAYRATGDSWVGMRAWALAVQPRGSGGRTFAAVGADTDLVLAPLRGVTFGPFIGYGFERRFRVEDVLTFGYSIRVRRVVVDQRLFLTSDTKWYRPFTVGWIF